MVLTETLCLTWALLLLINSGKKNGMQKWLSHPFHHTVLVFPSWVWIVLLSTGSEEALDRGESGGTQQSAHNRLLKSMFFIKITFPPWAFGSLKLLGCSDFSRAGCVSLGEEKHTARRRTDRRTDYLLGSCSPGALLCSPELLVMLPSHFLYQAQSCLRNNSKKKKYTKKQRPSPGALRMLDSFF